ncbi:MAG: hypothetical protein ABI855_00195 [Bacteroidota bacterium]
MNKVKFTFLLNLCFLFSLFYSCKKEDKNSTLPGGSSGFDCLPDITKDENDSVVNKYFYDNQKRISKIEYYGNGAYHGATEYTYNVSEVLVTEISGNSSYTRKYGLNSQGYPKYYTYPWSNPNEVDSIFYMYDSESYITQENDTNYYLGSIQRYSITTHQIVNGNRVYSLKNTFIYPATFVYSDTTYYEYYLDKQNTFDFDFGLNGKKSTNLLKHKYETYNGGLSWESDDFNYNLNAHNYIIKRGERTIAFQGGAIFYNDTSNVTITYHCN